MRPEGYQRAEPARFPAASRELDRPHTAPFSGRLTRPLNARSFVGFRLDDLLAAVETARADVMASMHFARCRLDRDRRRLEEVMRTMHPPF